MRNIKHMFPIMLAAFFLGGCPAPRSHFIFEGELGEVIELKGRVFIGILNAKYTLSEIVENTLCPEGDICADEGRFVLKVRRKTSFLKSAEYIELIYSGKTKGEYVSRDGYCAALAEVVPLKKGHMDGDSQIYKFRISVGGSEWCQSVLSQ